jgi:hypothetical protein
MLTFTSVYFFELSFFNELRAIQIKNLAAVSISRGGLWRTLKRPRPSLSAMTRQPAMSLASGMSSLKPIALPVKSRSTNTLPSSQRLFGGSGRSASRRNRSHPVLGPSQVYDCPLGDVLRRQPASEIHYSATCHPPRTNSELKKLLVIYQSFNARSENLRQLPLVPQGAAKRPRGPALSLGEGNTPALLAPQSWSILRDTPPSAAFLRMRSSRSCEPLPKNRPPACSRGNPRRLPHGADAGALSERWPARSGRPWSLFAIRRARHTTRNAVPPNVTRLRRRQLRCYTFGQGKITVS